MTNFDKLEREFAWVEGICMGWGNGCICMGCLYTVIKLTTPKFQDSCSQSMFKFRSRIFTEFARNHDSNRIDVWLRLIEYNMNVMYIASCDFELIPNHSKFYINLKFT